MMYVQYIHKVHTTYQSQTDLHVNNVAVFKYQSMTTMPFDMAWNSREMPSQQLSRVSILAGIHAN